MYKCISSNVELLSDPFRDASPAHSIAQPWALMPQRTDGEKDQQAGTEIKVKRNVST